MHSSDARPGRPISIALTGLLSLLPTHEALLAQSARPEVAASGSPLQLTLSATTQSPEQRSGEAVTYTLSARQGNRYLVEVEQEGLDFTVTVTNPAGANTSYNSPLNRDERELVLIENASAGTYEIKLASAELTDATGRLAIRVDEIPGNTDPRYIAALEKMTEAGAANAEGTRAKSLEALKAYQDAAELWRALAAARYCAHALYSVAMLEYWVEYDWTKAAETASTAAELYEGVEQPALQSNSMLLQARALIESLTKGGDSTSQLDAVLSLLRNSAALIGSGGSYERARREYFTGLAFNNVGDLEQGQKAWERAELLFDDADEWFEVLNVQFNLAVAAIQEGRNARAIETLEKILREPRHDSNLDFRASVLDNLAAAHRRLGNIDEALRTYSAALETHRQVEDPHGEANSLNGMASTYFAAGELALASEYAQQARTVADGAGEGSISSSSRTTLGNVAFLKSDYESALGFHETALEMTSSRLLQSQRHVLIAKDLVAMDRNSEAREHAHSALELAETAASPLAIADARQQLGMTSLAAEDSVAAISSFNEALELYTTLGLRGAQADAHHGLALAARAQGSLEDAIWHGEQSLNQVEALREKVSAPELRALYGAARRGYYETQVDLLMTRSEASPETSERFLAEALTASERARARLTIDLLAEASVDLYKDVDPKLAQRRRDLSDKLAELRSQQDRVLNTLPVRRDQLESLLQELASTENALNLLETELRTSNARYASVATVATLSAPAIQALLDSESVLLQYSLGETRSFVWVVTSSEIRAMELPDRNTIETAARRSYESLRVERALGSRDALTELARTVLDPVTPFLATKRVLVVADGALQYVPFSVLPVQTGETREPLLAKHEVVNLPSFSVLAMQRTRERASEGRKTLAVFADPVFEASDQRFPRRGSAPPFISYADGSAAAKESCVDCRLRGPDSRYLARLPATGAEATAIAALVRSDDRLIQTGFGASRANVLASTLGQYRVLHFATHGLVDSEYPALSALALSAFNESGQPQNGFLRLGDIYNLDLNADLVVLSACDTALGEAIRGEGLVGLTQGFIYAGAKTLVASLWQVPDAATAALMIRFYGYMLRDGQRPAEALRNAQLSLAAEQRWSDPFFWGAFTISGDWK